MTQTFDSKKDSSSGSSRPRRTIKQRLLRLLAVFSLVLAGLLVLGLISQAIANAVDAARYPMPGKLVDIGAMRHPEMTTLSEEQVRAFLAAASGDRLEAFYVLALATGMRVGELLALKWRDVDLGRATLQVRATLH